MPKHNYKQVVLPRFQYTGYTVVCIAGGTSVTQKQVDYCKNKGWKAIAINDAYRLAPWADILYACDNKWWRWNPEALSFKGRKITHEQKKRWDKILRNKNVEDLPNPSLEIMISDGKSVFEEEPLGHSQTRIKHGSNSGFQALCIALLMGASRVILLGYDMKPKDGVSHWFGEHPEGKQCDTRYTDWLGEFPALKKFADMRGQEIINCSPYTDLKCFQMEDLYKL